MGLEVDLALKRSFTYMALGDDMLPCSTALAQGHGKQVHGWYEMSSSLLLLQYLRYQPKS